ncbi:nickel-dependent hydrogenase large subunit [Hydrogenophilus thermoluteolus]|uniref:Uptake hydrogenase large subunit n=2 Tax=Hydrogenophilus thermoluteolus TaxID=297 RepID=A0A2Z6DZB3_HYDTE|nr:nickel-dependent hydrogenase large subunit [Hydrogenophilus thermoluteolus]BBD77679.1 uptake hydrogenase large subunit [Hydrogenophilus thermoluteolus]
MTTVRLGPFNRVEGDLEVTLTLDAAGFVTRAQVNSPLFRGFERILQGRAPLDALTIVPRICGICSVAQSMAAAQALADWARIKPVPNGALVAQTVLAVENLADHLTHFFLFFMPDFTHSAYRTMPWFDAAVRRFAPYRGESAARWLAARAQWFHLVGLLAGRWPHTLAVQPSGTTRTIHAMEQRELLRMVGQMRRYLTESLFGDTLDAVLALDSADALLAWAEGRESDAAFFIQVAHALELFTVGRAYDRFLSYGAYRAWPAGVWERATAASVPLDEAAIVEEVAASWLGGAASHPAEGETVPWLERPDAYSWCKAPRYHGAPAETGALARAVVAGVPLARDLVQRWGGSLFSRVIARLWECARIVQWVEAWLTEIDVKAPFIEPVVWPNEGRGVGLVEAARGALGHWLEVANGRIQRYQIIAPTTWNFSPRDQTGQPGPLEKALEGLTTGAGAMPFVHHVVRSFDPCMVCTVH